MLKKIFFGLLIFIGLMIIGYFLGPKPSFELVDNEPSPMRYDVHSLDHLIDAKERSVPVIKEDNEARIVWADSIPTKTEYSIVYIHGFSASQGEGYPTHINIADSLKANLYLTRLPEHGINDLDAMKNLTPKMLVDAAKNDIAIGKSIGEKVIVMGCSTGGTLALYLAANDPEIHSLILLSPNIEVKVDALELITGPWGEQLAYNLIGEHRVMDSTQSYIPYWSHRYHTNGLIALQALLDQTMTAEIFSKLSLPIYCAYFYKNEDIQDQVVAVDAIRKLETLISTKDAEKEFESFERGNHVLASIYKNDDWESVQNEVLDFIITKL